MYLWKKYNKNFVESIIILDDKKILHLFEFLSNIIFEKEEESYDVFVKIKKKFERKYVLITRLVYKMLYRLQKNVHLYKSILRTREYFYDMVQAVNVEHFLTDKNINYYTINIKKFFDKWNISDNEENLVMRTNNICYSKEYYNIVKSINRSFTLSMVRIFHNVYGEITLYNGIINEYLLLFKYNLKKRIEGERSNNVEIDLKESVVYGLITHLYEYVDYILYNFCTRNDRFNIFEVYKDINNSAINTFRIWNNNLWGFIMECNAFDEDSIHSAITSTIYVMLMKHYR